MRRIGLWVTLTLGFTHLCASQTSLSTIAAFVGSGSDSIQAMATDAAGYLYVVGNTTSVDLPVLNAAFAQHAESALMRSQDGGATWSKLPSPPAPVIYSIATHPVDPLILFAAANKALYRSNDGGQTWRSVYSGHALHIAVDPGDPAHVVAVTQGFQVAASADGGETWSAAATLLSAYPETLAVDPSGSGSMLICDGFVVQLSRDRGITWTRLKPPDLWPQIAAFDPLHPGSIYLATNTGTLGRLFFSGDYGVTWTEKVEPIYPFSAIQSLLVDPESGTLYAAPITGPLYQSNDQGQSWIPVDIVRPDSGAPLVIRRSVCGSAKLVTASSGRVVSTDLSAMVESSVFGGVRDIAAGADCDVYAARQISSDVFLAKIASAQQQVVWSTFLGGAGIDWGQHIALDSAGHVYVAGFTESTDFPVTATIGSAVIHPKVFVAKFSPDGELLQSTLVARGGFENDSFGFAVDPFGAIYLAARTNSADFPVTTGSLYLDQQHPFDGFLLKLDPDGGLIYSAGLRTGDSLITTIAVDADDIPVIVGSTQDKALPVTPDALQSTMPGFGGGFLLRTSPDTGALIYLTYLSGTEPWSGLGLSPYGIYAAAFDADGDLLLSGTTAAPDFPVTPNAYVAPTRSVSTPGRQPIPAGDVYIMKLDADLQPIYSALWAAQYFSTVQSLAEDAQGSPVVALSVYGQIPLVNSLTANSCALGGALVQLSPDGSQLQLSSFVDQCGAIPAVATGPGAAIYVGVNTGGHAAVIQIVR